MKNQLKISSIFIFFLALQACSKPELDRKKDELADLKKESSQMRAKLKENEKKIMLLDAVIAKADGKSPNSLNNKLISVQTAESKYFAHFIDFQGLVSSNKDVMVTAKGAGTIKKLFVKKGDRVRVGTLIALIDDEGFTKGIAELNTQLSLAKIMYDKQKTLWDQNVGSEVQFLSAKTQYEALKDKLATTKYQQAEATRIIATVSGTVEEVMAVQGQNAGPGSPICQIFGDGQLKIKADVSEAYSKNIKLGAAAIIDFPDYNKKVDSKITLVSNIINPYTRSFTVEFDSKATQGMKANTIAYAKVKDYSNAKAITLPTACIMHEGGQSYLFVLAANNIAKKVNVTKGLSYENQTEILSGIQAGDKIIVTGYQDITEGETVKLN